MLALATLGRTLCMHRNLSRLIKEQFERDSNTRVIKNVFLHELNIHNALFPLCYILIVEIS